MSPSANSARHSGAASPALDAPRSDRSEAISYGAAVRQAMRDALRDPRVIIMGQGVSDHKGTFGTTLGLAEEFGRDRVIEMPIAEDSMTGIALGASLHGLYPIQTHIRADFGLLATNQLINLIAKYRYMFGGAFEAPMLIRMVVGRSWGQGAQHSQSPQSLFAHIPGLSVIMPSSAQSILDSYAHAVRKFPGPVISIEHRLLYDLEFKGDPGVHTIDPFASKLARPGRDVTVVATSIMVLQALRAADFLSADAGIDCEIIDLHSISHPNHAMILESVERTGRLVVIDTSWRPYGVSAEICRIVCESSPGALRAPVVTLGMQPAPCPTAKNLEDMFYPEMAQLVDAIARVVRGSADHGVRLPDEGSMADLYKRFRGPF